MSEKKLFEELNAIKKLLAAIAIKETKTFKEQVKLLSEVGLKPREIADITGKNVNLVRVTKTGLKKKR